MGTEDVLPPPPTTIKNSMETSKRHSPPTVSDNPLDMLIAPPTHGTAVARGPPNGNNPMGSPPGGKSLMGPPATSTFYSKAPPLSASVEKNVEMPKFTIFQPTPKTDSNEKNDD